MYAFSALVSLILYGMAMTALILGISTFRQSDKSKVGLKMLLVFASVFVWDAGYAWMGLCYESEWAYVARAIALLGVYIYMLAAIEYVGELARYPRTGRSVFAAIYGAAALISWLKIIQPSSVSFVMTPWGYWFKSTMTWGRYLQFACILVSIVFFFIILSYWRHTTVLEREHMIIKRFTLFAPIMFCGYVFDTLMPSLYDIAAVPGSAVSAFISAMLLYGISRRYMAFGIYERNISQYVFRDVNVPVLVLDGSGKTVIWNRIAPAYFGVDSGDMAGLKLDELISLTDEDELLDGTDGEEIYIVNNGKSPDTERKAYCRLSKTSYYDEFNDLMYTICFVQDVTDIREAMSQMNISRRIAEDASTSKSVFLANMSHEVRTPMNAIMGISDILLADPQIRDDERRQIRNIYEAGNSVMGIINDVLDISKIEAGHNDMVEAPYSLPDMLHAINSIIRVKIAATSLEYIVDVDETLPQILIGDEPRIRQIFMNLITFVINCTEKGYIHIRIRGEREYGGLRMYADISDTGAGLRPEEAGHLFDAFTRIDTHRMRVAQGAGLGLSISRRLAQAMDGDITVESAHGRGTVFHVNIFQRMGEDEPIGAEMAAAIRNDSYEFKEKRDSFAYREYPDKSVLVVDDSKVNLMVAKGLLAPYGLQVDVADRGTEAVRLAAQHRYDIILMDHMMPEMDGVETLHAIRDLGGYNLTVPIIALTANAVDGTRDMLIAEGMQDFIAKPIDKKILNDVIEKYC